MLKVIMHKKYSVLSFIIGHGYEILHEISNPQNDVEYLMITDDPNLTSNTWTIIYDDYSDDEE